MASYFEGGWPSYVPVAERRKKAAREAEKLRKKGYPISVVAEIVDGCAGEGWAGR